MIQYTIQYQSIVLTYICLFFRNLFMFETVQVKVILGAASRNMRHVQPALGPALVVLGQQLLRSSSFGPSSSMVQFQEHHSRPKFPKCCSLCHVGRKINLNLNCMVINHLLYSRVGSPHANCHYLLAGVPAGWCLQGATSCLPQGHESGCCSHDT